MTLRLRFDDFSRATRSHSLAHPTSRTDPILATVRDLADGAMPMIRRQGLTLVGISVANFDGDPDQLELPIVGLPGDALDGAVDRVRDKFGSAALTRGVLLGRDPGHHHADAPARLGSQAWPASRAHRRSNSRSATGPSGSRIRTGCTSLPAARPSSTWPSYYLSVGEGIVRALRERPCMLHRFPDGVDGEKVHQKRLPHGAPPWVQTVRVHFPRYNRDADELCVTELG